MFSRIFLRLNRAPLEIVDRVKPHETAIAAKKGKNFGPLSEFDPFVAYRREYVVRGGDIPLVLAARVAPSIVSFRVHGLFERSHIRHCVAPFDFVGPMASIDSAAIEP
jgi:hypothetical protein